MQAPFDGTVAETMVVGQIRFEDRVSMAEGVVSGACRVLWWSGSR